MKKTFKILTLLITISLLFTACSSSKKEEVSLKKFISNDKNFELSVDKNWTKTDPQEAIANFQLEDKNEAALLVANIDKKTFAKEISLEEFSKLSLNGFSSRSTDFKSSDAKSVKVDGHDAMQYEISLTTQNVKLKYLFTCIDFDDKFIQFSQWSTQPKFDSHREEFSEILSSLKNIQK